MLAEELHFGRAAERRRVSPQRVSQVIQALERRIGGALFERTSRRVVLTELGHQFRDQVRPHYQGIQQAVASATATARGLAGTLRVGAFSALWAKLFVDAGDALRRTQPAVDLDVQEISAGDAFTPLLRGEVDVMNASLPVAEPGITTGPVLLAEQRVLAISRRHPLAARDSVTLEDLASTPLLTAPYMSDEWNEDRAPTRTPAGRPVERGPHIHSLPQGLALISAGRGGFVLGARMTRYHRFPGVTYLPIRDAPPLQWALTWRTGAETPLLDALTRAIRDLPCNRPGTTTCTKAPAA